MIIFDPVIFDYSRLIFIINPVSENVLLPEDMPIGRKPVFRSGRKDCASGRILLPVGKGSIGRNRNGVGRYLAPGQNAFAGKIINIRIVENVIIIGIRSKMIGDIIRPTAADIKKIGSKSFFYDSII